MRTLIALFLSATVLTACGPKVYYRPVENLSYKIGEEQSATIGQPFASRETGQKVRYEVWRGVFRGWESTQQQPLSRYVREELI